MNSIEDILNECDPEELSQPNNERVVASESNRDDIAEKQLGVESGPIAPLLYHNPGPFTAPVTFETSSSNPFGNPFDDDDDDNDTPPSGAPPPVPTTSVPTTSASLVSVVAHAVPPASPIAPPPSTPSAVSVVAAPPSALAASLDRAVNSFVGFGFNADIARKTLQKYGSEGENQAFSELCNEVRENYLSNVVSVRQVQQVSSSNKTVHGVSVLSRAIAVPIWISPLELRVGSWLPNVSNDVTGERDTVFAINVCHPVSNATWRLTKTLQQCSTFNNSIYNQLSKAFPEGMENQFPHAAVLSWMFKITDATRDQQMTGLDKWFRELILNPMAMLQLALRTDLYNFLEVPQNLKKKLAAQQEYTRATTGVTGTAHASASSDHTSTIMSRRRSEAGKGLGPEYGNYSGRSDEVPASRSMMSRRVSNSSILGTAPSQSSANPPANDTNNANV